jgi:nuclear factor 4
MSIQTTTPTSPTFILNGCNTSAAAVAATNYNSIITSSINNNCVTTDQINPYLHYFPQQLSTNGVRNIVSNNLNVNNPSSSNNIVLQNNPLQGTSSQNSITVSISEPSNSASKHPSNELDEQCAIASSSNSSNPCAICGELGARFHYNVLSCLGCKGFFRRALKKVDQYECINDNKCIINKDGRNSCRSCRLRKCLDAGMDPSAVRPDRDFVNKVSFLKLPPITKPKKPSESKKQTSNKNSNNDKSARAHLSNSQEEWSKKLSVEMRTMLMNLLNTEIKISRGDTLKDPAEIYPLHITIREVIENPSKIKGKRTEMRYEPYRMAKNEELCLIVYRRVLAAIDWVEYLAEMVDGLSTDDRIALVKSCFAPLLLFKCSARTAMVTEKDDILCLSNFAFVPRNIAKAYTDTYHLDNSLVERLINELVKPFRKLKITEEEVVCLSAIIVLNPMAKDLSETGIQKISNLRDKIQDTLFQYIKESRTDGQPTSLFGNFLLYLPLIASLSNVLCENIRFAQTFSNVGSFPLFTSVFGCFPVEPLLEADGTSLRKNVEVQTDPICPKSGRGIKRRLPSHFVSPVENELADARREFRLLQPPCSYTLTEMFEDRMNDDSSQQPFQMDPQMTWPPRIQQGPSTSQMPNNFSTSYKHYPLQNSGSIKELISTRNSFPSQIPQQLQHQQHPHHHQQQPQQQQQSPPINYISSNNYSHAHYPSPPIHFNQIPYTNSYAPPPIENLTFEHHEK